MDETLSEAKVCESCGKSFGCGAKLDGCWCSELTLPERVTLEIKGKFGDCLCPECLIIFASVDGSKRSL
jgi:hypothetical protein